jgi:hypothetical protein
VTGVDVNLRESKVPVVPLKSLEQRFQLVLYPV